MTDTDILNVMQRVKGALAVGVALRILPIAPPLTQPLAATPHQIDQTVPGWPIQLIGKMNQPDGRRRCWPPF